jgi:heme exporter protein C
MASLANPTRFSRLSAQILPALMAIAAVLIAIGLWLGLVASPADYQQGESVRIMYIHVPSAWLSMFGYTGLAVCGLFALVWKHALADVLAKAIAPVGAAFAAITLVTGSLWGKPTWGTFWVWDARLTSVLILFFLYLGHIALTHAFEDEARGARSAAILALVGVVNIPIIKWSVDWWSTLHQPASITRFASPAIDPSMLRPLFVMASGMFAYFFAIILMRARAELASRKARALAIAVAGRADMGFHANGVGEPA